MKHLLTWCGLRAMGKKPRVAGNGFEDQSAEMAGKLRRLYHRPVRLKPLVWLIQEELLKDVADISELSDWFRREEVAKAAEIITKRPHPKNMQNTIRAQELEQQIEQ